MPKIEQHFHSSREQEMQLRLTTLVFLVYPSVTDKQLFISMTGHRISSSDGWMRMISSSKAVHFFRRDYLLPFDGQFISPCKFVRDTYVYYFNAWLRLTHLLSNAYPSRKCYTHAWSPHPKDRVSEEIERIYEKYNFIHIIARFILYRMYALQFTGFMCSLSELIE